MTVRDVMHKMDKSPEFMMFIEITGKLGATLVEFSEIYAKGDDLERVKNNLEAEIFKGNLDSLENVTHLKQVYEIRNKSLLKCLIVLKLLSERSLILINKLIKLAEQDASD